MTPEEIINKQTWEILQDIKEESLVPEEDGTFFYDTTRTVIAAGENSPSRERKFAIVRKLARDEKAIEIVEEIAPDWRGERNGFYLKVLQPQFDRVYEKYKKACDLTTYLKDYQEEMLKGDDNPSELYHMDGKKQTQKVSPIKHKGAMFPTGSGGGYYNRSHPIRPIKKQSAQEIVNGFSSSNYAFVLMVSEGILSASEFGSDGEANYQLQSAPGQLLMQERQLLSKFEELGLFRNLGEDGISAIAKLRDVDTVTIREIATEIKSRQLNPQAEPESKNEDLKTRQATTGQEIQWSGDFKWEGKRFVFGQYGNTGYFSSKDRKAMFEELVDAKGGWVTVKKLKAITKKGEDYVRPTLGQIERGLSKELRKFISIVSTEDDDMQPKPTEGSYRIKFSPKPL